MKHWWLLGSLVVVSLSACGGSSKSNKAGGGTGGGAGAGVDGDGSGGSETSGSGGSETSGSGGEATSGSGGEATSGSGGEATSGSSGSGGSGGSVAQSIPLQDVPRELAAATCRYLLRCNPLASALLEQPSCRDAFQSTFENSGWDDVLDAVDEGRAVYDAEAMASCLDGYADLDCNDLGAEPPSCDDAAVGTVARGDECTVDVECEGADDFCHFGGECPGTCAAPLDAGEVCQGDDECDDPLICSDDTGRCVEPAGEGEDCDGGVAPPCADNLFCLGDDEEEMTAGTCMPFDEVFVGEVGDECDFDNGPLCQKGTACTIAVVDDAPVFECAPLANPGADCNLGLPNACTPGYYCSGQTLAEVLAGETGTCAELLDPGDECDAFNPFGCGVFGAACVDGECVGRRDNGVACASNLECWSDNCVDGGCAPSSACE